MASNFRALFHLQFNQWSRHAKSAKELWPLSIDENHTNKLSEEELYARNKAIIDHYMKN